jgi:diguanylate cyclase (GGDEF)-like protein
MTNPPDRTLSDKVSKLQKDFLDLNKFFDLSKMVSQSSNLTDLSENIINFILRYIDVKNAAIFLEMNGFYKIISSYNIGIPDKFIFSNQNEAIWKFLLSGKPLSTLNDNNESIFYSFFENNDIQKLNSSVWLPLIFNQKVIGIISLGSKTSGDFFTEEDHLLYSKIIDYVSPIFNKYNIEQKRDFELKELQKTLHNISILYNLGQTMNFIDDLKALLNIILDKAIKNIGAEKGSLMLYDISTNELVIKVVYGLPDKEVEEKINKGLIECTRIKVGEGVAGSVFLNKTPIITNLGANDPRFAKGENSSNVNSILCVPLIVKGESIGVINITNKKEGKLFNQHDLDFIKALANQASIAIDNAQLYELATKDGLTKLYIHRHFYTLLDNEIKRSARYSHHMTVAMMDIDNFKSVNDTFGHKIGDQILREISAVISHTVRKIDIAARYGGEEFAVIFPETPISTATIIANRLRKNIAQIIVKMAEGAEIAPKISIGLAEFPTHSDNCDNLIEKADKALYYAKEHGKNRVAQYFDSECLIVFDD